jgi:L-2-amino-thiazoline-4-carboxylic acid hydrolase-like protein
MRTSEGGLTMRDFDLRKVTGPILLHLLKREMASPRLFLWRCVLTLPRFKKRIDDRFPRELIDLAALPLWIYLNLKRRVGPDKAFEIMRVAILTGGVALWNLAYQTVDKKRTFANFCDQELLVNKTGLTRWNELEVVDRTDHRFEVKVTRCLYHELATSVGAPELTPVICQIDNAGFNSYLPDRLLFHRGGPNHRISDGSTECRFIWELLE